MLKAIVLLAFSVSACYGAPSTSGTYCGETPNALYKCLNLPSLINYDLHSKCHTITSECDKATCLFRETKWLDGTVLDKTKMTTYFNQFAKDRPEWLPAVQHLNAACLDHELKAQGWYLNCPAYDVVHCVITSLIKKATPSQWSTSANCTYPRAYAADCPVCPNDCIAPQVPIGSCNACITLPRTP